MTGRPETDGKFQIAQRAAEHLTFLRQRIGADPHAVLQVAEAFGAQAAPQPFALGFLTCGHIEEHTPPLEVR